jgi:hypothetical protein
VTDYRAYLVGRNGHFDDVRTFASAGDDEAIIRAKQLLAGHDIELWSGARLVIRLDGLEGKNRDEVAY